MPSVCCMVATLDEWMKSKMGVSADGYVTIEYLRLSLIRVYLYQLSDYANYSITTSLIYK